MLDTYITGDDTTEASSVGRLVEVVVSRVGYVVVLGLCLPHFVPERGSWSELIKNCQTGVRCSGNFEVSKNENASFTNFLTS